MCLPPLLVSEWTDSPDGGSRAGQFGDHPGAHQERSQREPGRCRKCSDAHTSPATYQRSTCPIAQAQNNAVILTTWIWRKKRKGPWRSTWLNVPHSGLVHQASGTIMMTLPTPVLTKWQDLVADQHPVPSAASPYIRTHSSTYACMFTLYTSHYNLVYIWPAITHRALNTHLLHKETGAAVGTLPPVVLHTLWHCMFCVSMPHRAPMSTWYDQLVGTEWALLGAGRVFLQMFVILRHFQEWWFACVCRTAGRRWSQQPRRATSRWSGSCWRTTPTQNIGTWWDLYSLTSFLL